MTGELRLRAFEPEGFAVPLRGPLESPFGERWGRLHAGQDIAVLHTDRVRAAAAGVVARSATSQSTRATATW